MNIIGYQRYYTDMLSDLYNSWGFTKKNILDLTKVNTAVNPDGLDTWTFKYNGDIIFPLNWAQWIFYTICS